MRIIFILFLSFFLYSTPVLSQRGLSKYVKSAWKYVEKAWTAKQIYDWVNDSRSNTYSYLNPSGRWRSTSGNIFDLQLTSYGAVYQNIYDRTTVYCYSTGVINFYEAERTEAHYYLTVLDHNTIVVNTCKGHEFWWTRIY